MATTKNGRKKKASGGGTVGEALRRTWKQFVRSPPSFPACLQLMQSDQDSLLLEPLEGIPC